MKFALPVLNFSKVKQIQAEDNAETVPSPSSTVAKPRLTQHRAVRTTFAPTSNSSGGNHAANSSSVNAAESSSGQEVNRRASHASASTSKPSVPLLNLARQDGGLQVGFGSAGGIDSSISARGPVSTQHAQFVALAQAQRGAVTARAHIGSISASTATVESEQKRQQQQQQRNESSASTTRQQPPAAAGQRPESVAVNEDAESDNDSAWESGSLRPSLALRRYSEYLTPFEQSEILDFPEVFFVGRCGAPKIKGNQQLTKCNFGYDDDRGDYIVVPHDHLAYRYEILSVMGKGSFGQVLKCHDFRTSRMYAVKIIRNKKRFHHQALVELKVLKYLVKEDPDDSFNVVHMQEHFTFRNHLCIAFELLSINLYEFIKQNNFMGLSLGLIKRFAQQMLVSLKFLKDLDIVHCDLKPENVMLRQPNRSIIKVIDFGSSCLTDERIYTYIQSRFYRAPEVILGLPYGTPIDMWSFGCILAELLTGYPLFPGEDETEQLQCMMEVLNVPSKDIIDRASRRKLFFDSEGEPRITPNSNGKLRVPGAKSLSQVLKCTDGPFMDLLQKCFLWDPGQRLTPEQALSHPWITGQLPQPLPPHRSPQPLTSVSPAGIVRSSLIEQSGGGQGGGGKRATAEGGGLRTVASSGAKQSMPPLQLGKLATAGAMTVSVRGSLSSGVGSSDMAKALSSGLMGAHQISGSPRSLRAGGNDGGGALHPTQLTARGKVLTPVTALVPGVAARGVGGGHHQDDGEGHHHHHALKRGGNDGLSVKGTIFSPRQGKAAAALAPMGHQASYLDRFLPMLTTSTRRA